MLENIREYSGKKEYEVKQLENEKTKEWEKQQRLNERKIHHYTRGTVLVRHVRMRSEETTREPHVNYLSPIGSGDGRRKNSVTTVNRSTLTRLI